MPLFFRFKQFTVHQGHAAMKVSTDGCILGAWTAGLISRNPGVKRILDIGTGTGLLSLMLAQQCLAGIVGVELDPAACRDATRNFHISPWKDRLKVLEGDGRLLPAALAYDFIITNPPFHSRSLKSRDTNRNLARHDTGLDLPALIKIIHGNLVPGGACSVMLPPEPMERFIGMARGNNLFPSRLLSVYPRDGKPCSRIAGMFSKERGSLQRVSLTVQIKPGLFSPEFLELMTPYYLPH